VKENENAQVIGCAAERKVHSSMAEDSYVGEMQSISENMPEPAGVRVRRVKD
jgi:hypothetical protein